MIAATLLIESPVRLWRCPLPLPNVLKAVNGYVLAGAGEVVLIDPGFQNSQTRDAWEAHLQSIGLDWEAVTGIIVTHYHPDHCGMAGWIQRHSGATVYMTRKTAEIMTKMWGVSISADPQPWHEMTYPPLLMDMFVKHGLPPDWQSRFEAHFESFQQLVTPLPVWADCEWIEGGGKIRLCGLEWQIIAAEGHASGQIMLWQERHGWLFCADHVLPDISPNITVLAGDDPQPLATFLADLRNVRDLPVVKAFPGHRGVLTRWTERIDELLRHHEIRLEQIADLVEEHAPVRAWTLVPLLYNKINTDQQMRFALAEMIAHLLWLTDAGIIRMERLEGDQIWYRSV